MESRGIMAPRGDLRRELTGDGLGKGRSGTGCTYDGSTESARHARRSSIHEKRKRAPIPGVRCGRQEDGQSFNQEKSLPD